MKEMNEQIAKETFSSYIEEGLKMIPPFKGYGMKFIQFSIDEPEMYQLLFLKKRDISYNQYLNEQMQWEKAIPALQSSLGINEKDAKWLFKNLTLYAHGMATLFSTSACVMTEEEIAQNLGEVFRGLMMQLKAPKDERVKLIPSDKNLEGFNEYVVGKKNVIVGYGSQKEMYQIRLDAIYYFEAVDENVYAYTKDSVFEVKRRLYQIEEKVTSFSFIRISKSLLVNTKKIVSVTNESGGRGKVLLMNDEVVIASRFYYKDVVNTIKGE